MKVVDIGVYDRAKVDWLGPIRKLAEPMLATNVVCFFSISARDAFIVVGRCEHCSRAQGGSEADSSSASKKLSSRHSSQRAHSIDQFLMAT
jgi:hypothetical protein